VSWREEWETKGYIERLTNDGSHRLRVRLRRYPESGVGWYHGEMDTVLPATPAVADADRPKDDPTIWRVDDALWAKLEPLLRCDKVRKKPGRPRRADRPIFDGLIWLARTGSQWAALPREFGPKSTVHARFTEWVDADKLAQAWTVLLREYDATLGLDWTWVAADGCIVKAPFGKKGGLVRRKPPAPTPPTGGNPVASATS
jgi:transposase